MLATRIIPSVLCRGRLLVKGERFNSWRTVGMAAQAVRIHQQRGVDELCLLDIGATPENRGPDLKMVEELSECCFSPLAVGGGVRTAQHVRDLLNAGADKVVIGTAAWEVPNLVREVADLVGCQAIVVAVDVRDHRVVVRCGGQQIDLNPVDYARAAEKCGAGEILLTSVENEGRMVGYDLDLIAEVSRAVGIPVIAHGGCSGGDDMAAAVKAGASACAAGALFQFTDTTPRDCADALNGYGIPARIAA